MSELETRLRWACDGRGWPTTTMCREAAERIRDLEAEVEALRAEIRALVAENALVRRDTQTGRVDPAPLSPGHSPHSRG
jgi:hypothetical protein